MANINRLKAILAERGRTNKWLAEQLGKDPVTISKWCTNTTQPDLPTLLRISELLNIDIRELLISNR
jgi:transcriptional regulator with XRE-family HTH domain